MPKALYLCDTYKGLAIGCPSEGGVKFVNGRFTTEDPVKMQMIERSDFFRSGAILGGLLPENMEEPAEAVEEVAEPPKAEPPSAKGFSVKMTKEDLLAWLTERSIEPPPGASRQQLLGIASQIAKSGG